MIARNQQNLRVMFGRARRRLGWLKYNVARELRTAVYSMVSIGPKIFARTIRGGSAPASQAERAHRILRWPDAFDGVSTVDELRALLVTRQVRFFEGHHTLYIPPQADLGARIGRFVQQYPPSAGFKIPKRFAPPQSGHYLIDADYRWVTRTLMGGVPRQAAAAATLHAFGLGPRLYDVAELSNGSVRMTCFVVEHVDGEPPSPQEHRQFMQKLQQLLHGPLRNALALATPSGLHDTDFTPPDCHGNLLRRRDGQLLYVDFQQLLVLDRDRVLGELLQSTTDTLHFGDTRLARGGRRYLYQSVPGLRDGKRDSALRWNRIVELLGDHGTALSGRVVLDIGCNAGMMLGQALGAQASWGVGWDRPDVVSAADRVQALIGNGRTTFVPAELSGGYRLAEDIPAWLHPHLNGSVVFYLAVWRHIGFVKDLVNVPWKALVYEGHQGDTDEECLQNFRTMEQLWGCRLVARTTVMDSDSRRRPLALLLRESSE